MTDLLPPSAGDQDGRPNGHSAETDHRDDHDKEEDPEAMDRLMKKLGVMGRYQIIQIVIVCLSSTLFVFVMLNFVFIGFEPEHKCRKVNKTDLLDRYDLLDDPSAAVEYDTYDIIVTSIRSGERKTVASLGCSDGHEYVGGKQMSMVTEWDLVCDKRGIVGLVQSMFTLGLGMGVVLFTSLADRYGRKWVYMFDVGSAILTELALVFAPNIYAAIAIRFFTGFTAGGMCLIHCVVSTELVITKYRQLFWAVDCIWFSTNVMILSGIAYFLRESDWRYLQLTTPILGIHIFLAAIAVNETPVWYFAKGRYDDVKRILREACKMNGKNLEEVLELFQTCIKQAKMKSAEEPKDGHVAVQSNYTLLDIARNRYILPLVLISGFVWFTNSLAYYGLYLTSSTLAGDRFLNFFLMALLEVPSSLICMVLVVYMGRQTVTMIFLAMSAFSLLVSSILVALELDSIHAANASTAFFLLGKFTIGSSFNVSSAYTQELLVTTIRSVGTGICAMFARLGGIIAPFLLPLFQVASWAPGTILTFLCFVCLALLPILPETKGRQLPTTIEEVLAWRKSDKKKKGVVV